MSSTEWNSYLEDMLTSLIRTQRPSSFIFIGKYPYAGITGMLRRVGESSRTLWIPVRAKEDSIVSWRKIWCCSSSQTWPKIVKPPSYSVSTIFVSSNLDPTFEKDITAAGIEVSKLVEQSGVILIPSSELTSNWPLLEGKIVITIGNCTEFYQ